MKTLTPIAWSEGMFLKPHHFQQADLFQDVRLGYHLRTLSAFYRGVVRLQIEPDALENMVFRVVACEVVMPDGLVVRFPEDALVEENSFQDAMPAGATALSVFLTVRTLSHEHGVGDRFDRQPETRRDLQMHDNEAAVDFLVPKAKVLFARSKDDETLAGYEVVKIAEVRRTGKNAPRFELSPTYVHPALSIHASRPLFEMVKEVVDRAIAASQTLAQHRRERGSDAIGFGTGDYEQLLGRQMLNQSIPVLQHALANEAVHPWHVYGMLAGLRGGLTSYWPEENASAFPPYDHDDLAGCFGPLCESIRSFLERLIPVHYEELPLAREGSQFSTAVREDLFARGTTFVLSLTGGIGEDELRERIQKQGKVTSIADMPQLLKIAVSGVALKHLAMPPAEIPRYAGHVHFQVDLAHRTWARVKDAGTFAFYLADAPTDLSGKLFVVLRDASRGAR